MLGGSECTSIVQGILQKSSKAPAELADFRRLILNFCEYLRILREKLKLRNF